jgi:hypothetical protein
MGVAVREDDATTPFADEGRATQSTKMVALKRKLSAILTVGREPR